jgi:hypothetical protein
MEEALLALELIERRVQLVRELVRLARQLVLLAVTIALGVLAILCALHGAPWPLLAGSGG